MAVADYKPTLVQLMNFLHHPDPPYNMGTEFSIETLGNLTSDDVMRYFNFRTYGVPNPPNGHNLRPQVRSNTLKYWKKALSYFMPNRLMVWNVLSNVGNPTRTDALNSLLKAVKKAEVRGIGVPSKTRRAISDGESERSLTIFRDKGQNPAEKYGIPALINFQYHMISRIDCAAEAKLRNLKVHPDFDFALRARLDWSKNVTEERQAPWQYVFASMDERQCVHLSIGVWLEVFFEKSPQAAITPYLFTLTDNVEVPGGANASKRLVQRLYNDFVFADESFADTVGTSGCCGQNMPFCFLSDSFSNQQVILVATALERGLQQLLESRDYRRTGKTFVVVGKLQNAHLTSMMILSCRIRMLKRQLHFVLEV